jgi:hypothetical protein
MARTPGATGPGFIDLARGFLSALHSRINDPLWRLRVGRKKADAARAFAAWDAAVDACAREVLAEAPPEYTIAGAWAARRLGEQGRDRWDPFPRTNPCLQLPTAPPTPPPPHPPRPPAQGHRPHHRPPTVAGKAQSGNVHHVRSGESRFDRGLDPALTGLDRDSLQRLLPPGTTPSCAPRPCGSPPRGAPAARHPPPKLSLPPAIPPTNPASLRQGFETTSHAITWSLGLLAAHPRAQAALAAELAAAGLAPTEASPQPRGFEWGDLGRLPYLLAVIKESLRLFQPVGGAGGRGRFRKAEAPARLRPPARLPRTGASPLRLVPSRPPRSSPPLHLPAAPPPPPGRRRQRARVPAGRRGAGRDRARGGWLEGGLAAGRANGAAAASGCAKRTRRSQHGPKLPALVHPTPFRPLTPTPPHPTPRAPSSWSRSTPCPAPACCTAQTPAASAPSAG